VLFGVCGGCRGKAIFSAGTNHFADCSDIGNCRDDVVFAAESKLIGALPAHEGYFRHIQSESRGIPISRERRTFYGERIHVEAEEAGLGRHTFRAGSVVCGPLGAHDVLSQTDRPSLTPRDDDVM
jgi:hypothetical protein